MKHIFQKSETSERTLLLLHGTGGNEHDLIDLAHLLDPEASLLSLRGDENENGMNRFFKRLSEGVFDEDDLVMRTKNMHERLDEYAKEYNFDRQNLTAIGYSNGANIAASLIYHYEHALKKAVLFHPMVPRRGIKLPNLEGVDVFITAGENDPICPKEETEELIKALRENGANVEVMWTTHGHQLTREEALQAKNWLK